MAIRELPTAAGDAEVRSLVVEWSEAIAQGRFSDALSMFPSVDSWTEDSLRKTIQGYGVPEHDETLKDLLEIWGVDEFRVTSLFDIENSSNFIAKAIEVDRENLYGLDPSQYLGMVHYNDVPLSGNISDLTARFHIKKSSPGKFTLEFLDIHVM
jgi:hypothetical protein